MAALNELVGNIHIVRIDHKPVVNELLLQLTIEQKSASQAPIQSFVELNVQ